MKFSFWGYKRFVETDYRPVVVCEIDFKNELIWWRRYG